MHVTIAGLLDVADGRGPKVDEGALLRWLAEMIWFPSAALGDAVAWRPIDDTHAEATVTSRDGVSASGVFAFDRDGRVVGVDADRWFGADGPRERWSARNTEWRSIRGVEVPTRGEVTWHLQKGDFTFYRWEITDVEADCPFTSLGN